MFAAEKNSQVPLTEAYEEAEWLKSHPQMDQKLRPWCQSFKGNEEKKTKNIKKDDPFKTVETCFTFHLYTLFKLNKV